MLSVKKIDNNLIFNEIERGYENRNECVKVLINNTDKIYNLKNFSEIIICTYDLNYSSKNNDMRNKSNYIKKLLDNSNTIFYVTQNDEFEKCFPDFNFVCDIYQNNNLFYTKNYFLNINNNNYKYNKVGWYGNINVTNRTNNNRKKLLNIGNNNKDLFDIIHVDSYTKTNFKSIIDIMKDYSILLDIEGGGYSARLKYLLFSNKPLLVVDRPYKEFFFKNLKEYIHYIPVKRDLSDLIEKTNWILNNYNESLYIANNALEFAKTYLSEEYVYRHIFNIIDNQNKI
tara:strand:+ start:1032 stop:1886 length:855 start_codon:yes stop_codon:yes gene_type:complete